MISIIEELLLPREAWAERTNSEYSLVNRDLDRIGMVMKYISAGDKIKINGDLCTIARTC